MRRLTSPVSPEDTEATKKALPIAITAAVALGGLLLVAAWLNHHPDFLPKVDIQTTENRVPLHSLLQQDKALLLNFWSVNCGPCHKEIPQLKQLHQQHGDKVKIVAVTMHYDPPDIVLDMAKGLPYQVALDLDGTLAKQLGARFTPTYLMVDKDGAILDKYVGRLNFDSLIAELEHLNSG